jgi:hypothetical protein
MMPPYISYTAPEERQSSLSTYSKDPRKSPHDVSKRGGGSRTKGENNELILSRFCNLKQHLFAHLKLSRKIEQRSMKEIGFACWACFFYPKNGWLKRRVMLNSLTLYG